MSRTSAPRRAASAVVSAGLALLVTAALGATPAIARQPAVVADTAVALRWYDTTVYTSLVELVPARTAELGTALAASLAGIPAGAAREGGLAAGRAAATTLLAERAGDGLDPASVNRAFPAPTPAPGVWQPTPPAFSPAIQAGTRYVRPFTLTSADQFRPGPPPALNSARYRADLAEVRAYGALDSAVRTTAQTATATFWLASSYSLYLGVLRAALTRSAGSLADQVALVAIFHVALVDTQIATSDAKYAYLRWRPVTAIRNDAVDPDPGWTPLYTTPAHPDYPSGHNTYAGAAEGVLTALLGPAVAPFTISSSTAVGVSRTYRTWHALTEDNLDARVFSGIHTRSADEAGVRLGLQVAGYVLRQASGGLFAGSPAGHP